MAYADLAYAIEVYGENYVKTSCDRDADDEVDIESFERALIRATSRINGFLVGKIGLPLTLVPEVLRIYCVDLAIEDCSSTADTATEIKTKRAERAMSELKLIAAGKMRLIQDETEPGDGEDIGSHMAVLETEQQRSTYLVEGTRAFTRTRMRDL